MLIKAELSKEFERRQQDRQRALYELSHRTLQADESDETFAHKLIELVKLAYSSFEDTVQKAKAKDYFVKGLHQDMQVVFFSSDNNLLAADTPATSRYKLPYYQNKGMQSSKAWFSYVVRILDFEKTIY